MDDSASNRYLSTEILTATPQKLHLVSVEATIRAIERGKHHWQCGENDKAFTALIRAQQLVCEILNGFDAKVNPELVQSMAALYTFVFQSIVEGNRHRDEKKLDDALRVLAIERETWRAVCDSLAGAAGGEAGRGLIIDPPDRGMAGPSGPHSPPRGDTSWLDHGRGAGFSCEA